MTDIFKQKWSKEDLEAADDPKWAPAVVQWPKDNPTVYTPALWTKRKWPAETVNVKRPRFGHDY